MKNFEIYFEETGYEFPMIFIEGTNDSTYLFGATDKVAISIRDFYISKYPVTQQLWENVMGNKPSDFKGKTKPVENVSFDDINNKEGFLEKLNSLNGKGYSSQKKNSFRLPTETEWEYAARGGIHWRDDFMFSGSNTIEDVGWNSEIKSGTQTHPVGEKLPNQLSIHDMCGNVWEWCEDYYQPNINLIPKDGSPYLQETESRVLRGGCHHNWAVHCTVSKRYEIGQMFKDGCIGFRIAAYA